MESAEASVWKALGAPYQDRLQEVWEAPRPLHIAGLKGGARAFWAAALYKTARRPTLFLLADEEAAQKLASDLRWLLGSEERIAFLPSRSEASPTRQHLRQLEQTFLLSQWLEGGAQALCAPVEVLREPFPHPARWTQHRLRLEVGSTLERDFLLELLTVYEFTETDKVNSPGEFAWRGGVVDVFSYAYPQPLRLRLEGETLTHIQFFSVETQLSQGDLTEAWLLPAPSYLEEPPSASLLDFLTETSLLVLVEGQACLARIQRHPSESLVERFLQEAHKAIELGHEPAVPPAARIEHLTHPQPSFSSNLALLHDHLRQLPVERLYLVTEHPRQQLRLERLLEPACLPYSVTYLLGNFSEGFYDPARKEAFYTDHQIFRRTYAPSVHRSFRRSEALVLRELYELKAGDIVVHRRYGIARFGGLVTIPHTDPPQEGVKLYFADDAVLYVPVTQLQEIGRYRAPTDEPPRLSRLGASDWQRTTERVRKRLHELAVDLVRLYARRRLLPGYAFGPDTLQQLAMESRFPYEETPDQLQATQEIKKAMESPHPMDHLLCGDVGFGKTEVALRAAFKATQEGKQVALLAPTTVLVMQHLRTFEARLEGFPVRIAALSRLQTARQQKEILQQLAKGEIDILIGTHRLLSDDVQFRDLGLLIIDEEHKFGVMAKEKLRERYPTVDTLSMSATPIPRTLQMALSGIRDISLITTPPPNRLPVQTYVKPFSWELVQEALTRELDRGGQAFFVHNNIAELPGLTHKLQSLLPQAEIAFVHARMPSRQVEDLLLAFIYQQIDVLVTTNLVESGLDIPNANTILVHHAHRFGLSDLHQLRGRVGRSGRQAYCYFLVPGLHHLSPEALRRLQALEEFTDLGSGFQIALRDLEIRGAGNFFGREQSGFIADIGYDLYQQFLEEAIARIQEEEGLTLPARAPSTPSAVCSIEVDWEARLPESWIPYPATRLEVYQRFSQVRNEEELKAFLRELLDRFGSLPPQVLLLADVLRLRWIGEALGLPFLRVRKQKARFSLGAETNLSSLLTYLESLRPRYTYHLAPDGERLEVHLSPIASAKELLALLEGLKEALQPQTAHDLGPVRNG